MKISKFHKGKIVSKETRAKMSESAKRKASISDETKKKLSDMKIGIKNSPEHNANIRKAIGEYRAKQDLLYPPTESQLENRKRYERSKLKSST